MTPGGSPGQNPLGPRRDQRARAVDLAVGVGKAMRPWIIGLAALGAVIGALLMGANSPEDPGIAQARANPGGFTYEERRIQVGDQCILVQVADTQEKRAQGLRGRDRIDPYDGMLFVFEQTSQAQFTMSGVEIPLTIGFYDQAGTQVDQKDMEPCPDGKDCPVYESKSPFDNALEVPQGELPAGSYTGTCPA